MSHTLFALTGLLAAVSSAVAEPIRFDSIEVKKNPSRTAPLLSFEQVGEPTGRPWVKPLGIFQIGESGQWRHVFYFKKQGKNERVSWPVTLNLNTGELTEHPGIPGLETWKTGWLDGKLYLGQNIPGHVIEYDPEADTFTDLGHAFENSSIIFRMATTHDGKLALAGNHPAEVSVYDPETKTFRKYGRISEGNSYCYELGVDGNYLYGATRGKSPWELIAVDRTTGERTLLTTRPTGGYINLSGNHVSFRDKTSEPFENFVIEGTTITPYVRPKSRVQRREKPPQSKVYHDASTAFEGGGLYTIHYQSPTDMKWMRAPMKMPFGGSLLQAAVSLPDGRIIAAATSYVPIIMVDPKTGKTRKYPLESLSVRSAMLQGEKLLLCGYPSASVFVLDLTKPLTPTQTTPFEEAVPSDHPDANPRLVTRYPMTDRSGGHIGIGFFPGPDGRVYLCTRRHRHHRGFSIAWFDPRAVDQKDVGAGEVDTGNAFDHLQIGGITLTQDGSKLLISTYVEPNSQIEGEVPAAAKLFVLDLATQKIVNTLTPVADSNCLTGIVEVAPGRAVGLALDNERRQTIIYRINVTDGAVEDAVCYPAVLMGLPGVSSVPVKGPAFVLGPDGMIWTSMNVAAERSILLRVDPTTLSLDPIGLDKSNGRGMLFHQGALYMTGAGHLQRVVLPERIRLGRGE